VKTDINELERMVDMIHALEEVRGAISHTARLLQGLSEHDVLATETAAFDSDGVISRDYTVPFASVSIGNMSGGDVVIATGGPTSAAPRIGAGITLVPAGASVTVNMTGHEVTFYGTAGGRISFSVFTKSQGPAFAGAGDTPAGTPTMAADVAVVAAGVVVLAANTSRKAAVIQNTGAEPIRIGPTGSVSQTRGIRLAAYGTFAVEKPYCPTVEFKAYKDTLAGGDSTATALEIA
jgi:hypothetical protein